MAQSKWGTIRGRVIDESDKHPLLGVNITVRGTVIGTASDKIGEFALKKLSPGNYFISFSMVGYERKTVGPVEIQGDESKVIEVSLKPMAIQSEPVIVTASRREQRIQEAPVSIATITARELDLRNNVTLDEALRYVPGINVIDGQINIRGSSGYSRGVGSRVLLLLDGLPLLTGDTRETNWETIPVQQIERVEIVKGAGSALYGSSALGGVINVITRDVPERPEVRFKLYSGVYDSPRYKEWKWWDTPRFNSGAFASYSQRVGSLAYLISIRRSVDESYKINDVFHRWNFSTTLKYDISNSRSIFLNGNFLHRRHGNYFWWKNLREATKPADGQLDWVVRSRRGNLSIGYKEFVADDFFYTVRGIYFGNFWKDDSAGRVSNVSSSHVFHGEVQATYEVSRRNILTFGVSTNYDKVFSSLFGDHPGFGSALYLQHEFLLTDQLRSTIGVRYDYQKVSNVAASSQISPKIALAYNPNEATSIRASVGTGFRYPSIAELYVQSTTNVSRLILIPNEKLRAEKSVSAEVGFSQIIGEHLLADISLFNSEFRDLIEAGAKIKKIKIDPTDSIGVERAVAEFENVTRARIQGLELGIRVNWFKNVVTSDLGYTFIWPRDLTEDAPLKFRPRHLFYGNTAVHYGNLSASVDLRYASRMERIDDAVVRLAPIVDGEKRVPIRVFDLHITYALSSINLPVNVGLNVKNLLNYHYVELIGNLAPVRTYFLTIEGLF